MRIKAKWLVGAVAVGSLVFAGTSTFTASNTLPSSATAGFGTITTSGGSVTGVSYTLDSTDPPSLATVTITDSAGDEHTLTASIGFGLGNGGSGNTSMTTCATGSYNSGTTTTTWVCTLSSGPLLSQVISTDIALTN